LQALSENLYLEVVNAFGSLVYAGQINASVLTTIVVDGWPDGLYAFVFTDANGHRSVNKVVIIHQ
jgi:hypothetical protein